MRQEILRLRGKGWHAKAIADTLGVPLARVWRVIAREYERLYRDGLATVSGAEGRIARAERTQHQLEQQVVGLRHALGEARSSQYLPDARWRARATAIAREPSAARRSLLLATPLDQEVPPAQVVNLRSPATMDVNPREEPTA